LYPKEQQKLKIGESTRLSCRATSGTPYPVITWSRTDGRPLSSRFSEDYPGVITLREATLDDAGTYECSATNAAGSTSLSATLEVQQAPTISLLPDRNSVTLTEGDELRFTCSASGIPAPSVVIKAPESSQVRPLLTAFADERSRRPEANIRHSNIQLHQGGLYECIATNEAGTDVKYIQVHVNEKRGDVGPDGDDGDDTDDNGEDNNIDRDPWAQRTTARPTWVQPTRPTQRPTRPPRPNTDHDGRPINPSQPVRHQPFVVHLGERAELNCNAEGNTMRTEWRRADGYPLPTGARIYGGTLIIESVHNDAAGSYECLAYDQSRRPITLILADIEVIAPPKITFSPPMPITVRSGEDVTIFCNATGEQPLRVYWHGENGAELPT